MPVAVMVCGPNGAGKTTFARQFMPVVFPGVPYLNADEMRRSDPSIRSDIQAGRALLLRISDCIKDRRSFALETTLATRSYARQIPEWKRRGFQVSVHFIELPTAQFAVERVLARVHEGGHSIPEDAIRRRFERGRVLFSDVYKGLADRWYHWYSDERGQRLVDHKE